MRCALGLIGIYGLTLFGQVNKSNLTGIVRDASGAAVQNAVIKLQNANTGASRQELTSATGLYRFTLLDPGVYRMDVAHPGFKRFTRDRIRLLTGETITIDVGLELGQVTESVTVLAEASQLRTETASVGTASASPAAFVRSVTWTD